MRYELVRNGIFAFLAGYFALGIYAFYFAPGHEFYPFFSWALFQKVPQHDETRFTVQFTEVDGVRLEEPVLARDAAAQLGFPRSTVYDPLIAFLVTASTQGNEAELWATRMRLEQLLPRAGAYDIVSYSYDPVRYWKERVSGGVEVIRSFERGI